MSTIGERIAALRAEAGQTQEQYAAWLHVKRATLANWETNRSDPDVDSLKAICSRHGVSLDYLWGRTDVRDLPTEEELLALLPSDIKAAFRGRSWHDLDPETRRHIAWAISMDLAQLKAKQAQDEPEDRRTE